MILSIGAYAKGQVWAEQRVASRVFRELAAGDYGFQPAVAYVNGRSRGTPLAKQVDTLAERLDSYGIDILRLTETEGAEEPEGNISLTAKAVAECYVTLRLPLATGRTSYDDILDILERLAGDSHAQYLYAHDWQDWRRVRRERGGDQLFLRSCARGAYWVTYFSREYVARLGGEAKLEAAPVYQVRKLTSGILLLAFPSPEALDQEPQRTQLQRLQEYLVSLVSPQDRP